MMNVHRIEQPDPSFTRLHLKPTPWDPHGKKASEKACYDKSLRFSASDLLLQRSHGKRLNNSLRWFGLDLRLLAKDHLHSRFGNPGTENTPVFFTSLVAMLTKLSNTWEQVLVLIPCSVAIVFNKVPLLMAFAPAFIDFIGGAMLFERRQNERAREWSH